MAFVVRSEKDTLPVMKNMIDVGPGSYPLQKSPSLKIAKVPFNSNTYRDTAVIKDNTPGPGSYDKELTLIVRDLNTHLGDSGEKSIGLVNLPHDKSSFFGSKDKRFKEQTNEIPGPGHYENLNTSFKLSPSKNNKIPSLTKKDNLRSSTSSIPSIPYRMTSYGYELTEGGIARRNYDPYHSLKFSGEKEDFVGPGSYFVDSPKKWHKNVIDWSKSNERTFQNALNKDKPDLNELQAAASQNYKKQIKGDIESSGLQEKKSSSNRDLVFKQIIEKRKTQMLHSTNNAHRVAEDKIFSETPGPGYYFTDKQANFNLLNSNRLQSFGSSSQRFADTYNIVKRNEVGPGHYFKDQAQSSLSKDKSIRRIRILNKRDDEKENKSISLDRKLRKVESTLGPGSYNPDTIKKQSPSMISNFGSLERRFVLNKEVLEAKSGPDFYLDHKDWVTEKIKNFKIPVRIVKESKDKPIIKEEIDYPSVGSYNSEWFKSIEYKIQKNIQKSQKENIPFLSLDKRFRENETNSIGPGYYYQEKKRNVERSPKLNQAVRFSEKKQDIVVGPGEYIQPSYFDWNKKSFNVIFN